MHERVLYVASDGTEWDDRALCERYERGEWLAWKTTPLYTFPRGVDFFWALIEVESVTCGLPLDRRVELLVLNGRPMRIMAAGLERLDRSERIVKWRSAMKPALP